MAGDDEQLETKRDRPRWNAKTAAMSPHRARAAAEEPGTDGVRPRFEIGDELGRGGMGSVVVATDTVLEREVAIKKALGDDAEASRLFEREAKITAQLEHPSIVPVHDAGRDEHGRPYYVMRRLQGEPLADRIARARDVKARLALVPNVLAAVDAAAFAHARGVIHRDIKPWNILIGDYGETVVIDWGLAQRIDGTHSDDASRTAMAGTPGYMAPEQVRGEPSDARADVYALGATLLHVLIGKIAIETTPTEWMAAAAAGAAPPIEKLDPEVPVELAAIMAKAMAPQPDDRYADAVEMAADLRAFLAGQLVAAHRYTPVQRLVRFVRRHRVAVTTGVAALAAIAVVAALAVRNVVIERDRASQAHEHAADQAELMLVERASTLASLDPTQAVALLRTLPVGSRHLRRARDIAAKAAANGIASGLRAHDGTVEALRFAPDGRRLASIGWDGTLKVHDLTTRTSRTLVEGKSPLRAVAWTHGGSTITYSSADGLWIVDVASGGVREIDRGASIGTIEPTAAGDHVRVYDSRRDALIEWPLAPNARERILAHDVKSAALTEEIAIVAGGEELRLIDARGEHLIWRDVAVKRILAIDIAPDRKRAVVAMFDAVIEWDLTSYKPTRRWPIGSFRAIYAGGAVYANNRARSAALDLLTQDGSTDRLAGNWLSVWSAQAAGGAVVVNGAGGFAFLDGDRAYPIAQPMVGAHAIAGLPGSPYVAIGSDEGWIRWFDLRLVLPTTVETPNGVLLCGFHRDRVHVLSPREALISITRGVPVQQRRTPGPAIFCATGSGPWIALSSGPIGVPAIAPTWDIVNGETGDRIGEVVSTTLVIGERSVYYVEGRRAVKHFDGSSHQLVWTAPADVTSLVHGERWFAAVLADGRLVRFDARGTDSVVELPGKVEQLALGPDDTPWLSIESRLYRADRHGLRLAAVLPGRPKWLGMHDSAVHVLVRQTLWKVVESYGTTRLDFVLHDVHSLGGMRSALVVDKDARAAQVYLDTKERVTRGWRVTGGIVDDSGSLLSIPITEKPILELYTDPVPQDPRKLHAWIDSATNAVFEPKANAMTWR